MKEVMDKWMLGFIENGVMDKSIIGSMEFTFYHSINHHHNDPLLSHFKNPSSLHSATRSLK